MVKSKLEYSLVGGIGRQNVGDYALANLPKFFDVCAYANRNDERLFESMSNLGGRLITGTVLDVGQKSLRIRSDFNVKSLDGWSEEIVYPWDRIVYGSFTKEGRKELEKHPLFNGIFGNETKGIFSFGYSYARNWFDLNFTSEVHDGESRFAFACVDMAGADGENPGAISIEFEDLESMGSYSGIVVK